MACLVKFKTLRLFTLRRNFSGMLSPAYEIAHGNNASGTYEGIGRLENKLCDTLVTSITHPNTRNNLAFVTTWVSILKWVQRVHWEPANKTMILSKAACSTLNVHSSILEKNVIDRDCCLLFEPLQNRLKVSIIRGKSAEIFLKQVCCMRW